jgi:hypothetical protein
MTAVTTLVAEVVSGYRMYQVVDSAIVSWPASGTAAGANVEVGFSGTLAETDLEYTLIPLGGGFQVYSLSDSVIMGNVPVQVTNSGQAQDNAHKWQVGVVLFADDAAIYGATGDSFQLNVQALFLVSAVYPAIS